MKIIGIGTDIVEVKKLEKIARNNKRFLERMFSPTEINYCLKRKNCWEHLAGRFAAKEAVFKSLPDQKIPLKSIEIVNNEDGRPTVILPERFREYRTFLSLTHIRDYAVAQAVLVK